MWSLNGVTEIPDVILEILKDSGHNFEDSRSSGSHFEDYQRIIEVIMKIMEDYESNFGDFGRFWKSF